MPDTALVLTRPGADLTVDQRLTDIESRLDRLEEKLDEILRRLNHRRQLLARSGDEVGG